MKISDPQQYVNPLALRMKLINTIFFIKGDTITIFTNGKHQRVVFIYFPRYLETVENSGC